AIYQLTDVVNADGDKLSYRYDDVGNLTHVIDPKKNETPETDDFTTRTDYDLNHRPSTVTDAAGETTTTTYDKDSLVIATTDQAQKTTETDYDERGLPIAQRVPYDTDAETVRTTKFTYDQAGNRTEVETPRGVATTATPDDFTRRTTYDELNRPVRQYQPYDPNDTRYHSPDVFTETTYDAVGNVSKVSAPPSEGETVRNETAYTHFDNGWIRNSTDPWEITTAYDYNDLGQQTSRTLTSTGGASSRTMGWTYHPDGSLAARTDEGVPVGLQTVLVDNSDTQSTSSKGDWTTSSPRRDTKSSQGYDHSTLAAGKEGAFTWQLNIPAKGDYTVYAKYPKTPDAAPGARYEIDHAEGTATATTDQSERTGRWVTLGTYPFKQGIKSLSLKGSDQGTVTADAVQLVRDDSFAVDEERKDFTYRYDANGNLVDINDISSGAKIDAYVIGYTGLNQVEKVTENLAGEPKKTTSMTYDANGQPATMTHPDEFQSYTYDVRNLIAMVEAGDSPDDPKKRLTEYLYTPRGQKLREYKANENFVDYSYYANGALKTTQEYNHYDLVASHEYDWDVNGNKSRDIAKKMNADDHTAYLESTSTYRYDPVDRIAQVTKTGHGATTETYVHDDNANVVSQRVKDADTTYTYNRNRLVSATSDDTAASYNYDPYGRLDTVTAADQVIERSTYDGFDHVTEHSRVQDSGTQKTSYTYDPLDRTTSKTDNSGKTTDYSYLGMSEEVLDERVAGEVTKSYQYGPWGDRLSQIKHDADGTRELGVYGYNSHTDVETLTDAEGNTKATYGYTSYGSNDESDFTGIDKPGASTLDAEPYNPYRFNSKRWDEPSQTYDMGFRDYDPSLNRFLTRDLYNGALADMSLGADRITGNRYAFAGGNPTTGIELDGHGLACGGEGDDVSCGDGNMTRADGSLSYTDESGVNHSTGGGYMWSEVEDLYAGRDFTHTKVTHHRVDREGVHTQTAEKFLNVRNNQDVKRDSGMVERCNTPIGHGKYICEMVESAGSGAPQDVGWDDLEVRVDWGGGDLYGLVSFFSVRGFMDGIDSDEPASDRFETAWATRDASQQTYVADKAGYYAEKFGMGGTLGNVAISLSKVAKPVVTVGATVLDYALNPPRSKPEWLEEFVNKHAGG
ncbi:golvesin C-terminal-like domain-containing protein, partial [Streptomyces aculeolatus]